MPLQLYVPERLATAINAHTHASSGRVLGNFHSRERICTHGKRGIAFEIGVLEVSNKIADRKDATPAHRSVLFRLLEAMDVERQLGGRRCEHIGG